MKHFYTYQEAADELGLSLITIKRAAENRVLSTINDPISRKRKYITRTALKAYKKHRALKNLTKY